MFKKGYKKVDKILLANGFQYWDDWEYGPMDGWSEDHDHISFKLMRHDFGYWMIFCRHAGGENQTMNIGESDIAKNIIQVRDILKKVANGNITKHSK